MTAYTCPICGDDDIGPWIGEGPFVNWCEQCHDKALRHIEARISQGQT